MKRILIIILTLSFIAFEFAYSQEGDKGNNKGSMLEKVLIDFGQYEEMNAKQGSPYLKEKTKDWETSIDTYLVTQEDMSIANWVVRFNASADIVELKNNSYAKKAVTKDGKTVLGVRIKYPNTKYNAHAMVRPLYEIMEYNKEGQFSNVGNGVIDNVGNLKALSVEVSGRNMNNRLYLRLIDKDKQFHDFFMGYLDFIGWRRLMWKNPNYINSIDQRDYKKIALYPQDRPYLKFHSFIISRLRDGVKGDFVVYFKSIEASYDKAEISTEFLNIDDEKVWGIQKHRALLMQAQASKRQANIRILREMELKRRVKSPADTKKEAAATTTKETTTTN